MKAQIVRGKFAGIPHGKTVIDIDSADAAALLGAATGLLKVVAGAAVVGAGIAIGIGIIGAILSGLQSSLTNQSSTRDSALPLGSAPTWVETSEGSFWGIVLDQDFELSVNGRNLTLPYSRIYSLEASIGGFFSLEDRFAIQLVDGSRYYGFRRSKDGLSNNVWPRTFSIQLATIGGIQNVPIKTTTTTGMWFWEQTFETILRANFKPAHISDIHDMRENLKYVLKQNNRHISNLIGQGVLQSFFNVSSIP